MLSRIPQRSAFVALAALALGCQAKIGDDCAISRDCSIRGERVCDLSNRVTKAGIPSPNGRGECTIEGCGRGSCPKEAACVRVFGSDFLSVACDPTREDIATFCDDGTCEPLNDCNANEICLPEGLCADQITARSSCRRKCKDDGDCRDGYECKRTGNDGVYRVFDPGNPTDDSQIAICRPKDLGL